MSNTNLTIKQVILATSLQNALVFPRFPISFNRHDRCLFWIEYNNSLTAQRFVYQHYDSHLKQWQPKRNSRYHQVVLASLNPTSQLLDIITINNEDGCRLITHEHPEPKYLDLQKVIDQYYLTEKQQQNLNITNPNPTNPTNPNPNVFGFLHEPIVWLSEPSSQPSPTTPTTPTILNSNPDIQNIPHISFAYPEDYQIELAKPKRGAPLKNNDPAVWAAKVAIEEEKTKRRILGKAYTDKDSTDTSWIRAMHPRHLHNKTRAERAIWYFDNDKINPDNLPIKESIKAYDKNFKDSILYLPFLDSFTQIPIASEIRNKDYWRNRAIASRDLTQFTLFHSEQPLNKRQQALTKFGTILRKLNEAFNFDDPAGGHFENILDECIEMFHAGLLYTTYPDANVDNTDPDITFLLAQLPIIREIFEQFAMQLQQTKLINIPHPNHIGSLDPNPNHTYHVGGTLPIEVFKAMKTFKLVITPSLEPHWNSIINGENIFVKSRARNALRAIVTNSLL
jgi:hypothetical protein